MMHDMQAFGSWKVSLVPSLDYSSGFIKNHGFARPLAAAVRELHMYIHIFV